MQLPAPALEQGVEGGVPYKRVLERVDRGGGYSAPGDEAGGCQALQRRIEVPRGQRRYRRNQLVGELSSDYGPDLRHILDWRKPVEAGYQRSLQRRGYGERRQRSVEHVAVRRLAQDPALEQCARQLFDEQRYAICVRKD